VVIAVAAATELFRGVLSSRVFRLPYALLDTIIRPFSEQNVAGIPASDGFVNPTIFTG